MKRIASVIVFCFGLVGVLMAQDRSVTEIRFFDEGSGLFYIVTGANSVEVSRVKTENLEPYSYEGDITIPEIVDFEGRTYTVTGIGEGAFSACQMLTSVAVPSTVTYVEYRAFYYCPSLQSVVLSDNIAEMGREVFR